MKFINSYFSVENRIRPLDFVVETANSNAFDINIITDVETGVQYIEVDGRLVPRLDSDGVVRVVNGDVQRKDCEYELWGNTYEEEDDEDEEDIDNNDEIQDRADLYAPEQRIEKRLKQWDTEPDKKLNIRWEGKQTVAGRVGHYVTTPAQD